MMANVGECLVDVLLMMVTDDGYFMAIDGAYMVNIWLIYGEYMVNDGK